MPTIYNKVVVDDTTIMDISDTTTVASEVPTGSYFYDAEGRKTVGTVPRRDFNDIYGDFDDGAYQVGGPAGYYAFPFYRAVPTGTEGVPTATKGTVSNHSVTVTPSVTNSAGYIEGGTKTGTGVSVSASELVSGSQTITENGTVNVTNLAEVVVAVQGGGSGMQVGKLGGTRSSASTLVFTGLKGTPLAFQIFVEDPVSTSASAQVIAVVYDGSTIHAQTVGSQVEYNGSFTHTYSNGTLTITSSGASFTTSAYFGEYAYGGSASSIDTKDVQVGSGATSITFTGLEDDPVAWSCIFKSSFSTSSGYQRVAYVSAYDDDPVGIEMDSSAKMAYHWTWLYNNGSLTITSNGTNQGGYFHQPGYYQLTAIYGEASPYQAKTVTPTTSQQVVEPDSGYDALSRVTVNPIPSEYVVPSGNLAITQNGNNINVSQYATVSVDVSGGSSDVATGTLNVASNVNTSTSTTIATTSTIGFTPTKFFFWKTERTATNNHVHQATFTTLGSNYIRTMTRYSSNALSTSGNTNNWTTQTAGYLYFNSNTVYFRSSSSYILSAGTWNWVAVK